jgi:hypothetical protein
LTGFFIDLTKPDERVLIAADTLMYTVADRHAPIATANKVIPFDHIPGALFGAGMHEIVLRAAAGLLQGPEIVTSEDVIAALPAILRSVTEEFCVERSIEDPASLMLLEAVWIGLDANSGKFEMTTFPNHENNYEPKRGFTGLIGLPNIPPAYVPPGFGAITSPEVRALAAMRAIRRFTQDHGAMLGMPPIGGEIMLTEITSEGVSDRVIGAFDDLAGTEAAIDQTIAEVEGDPTAYTGHRLINKKANEAAMRKKFEQLARLGMPAAAQRAALIDLAANRQQRRAVERATRRAAKAQRVA